jgi:predicted enzyme related to lactoylglutathione lyase
MFGKNKTFSSFAVNNVQKARAFYGDTLGLEVEQGSMPGVLNVHTHDNEIIIYVKPDHVAATFTVLNFVVEDVEKAVDELNGKGIKFEQYDREDLRTDEKGIMRGNGPTIAWFKDPSGNILSILEPEQ